MRSLTKEFVENREKKRCLLSVYYEVDWVFDSLRWVILQLLIEN